MEKDSYPTIFSDSIYYHSIFRTNHQKIISLQGTIRLLQELQCLSGRHRHLAATDSRRNEPLYRRMTKGKT